MILVSGRVLPRRVLGCARRRRGHSYPSNNYLQLTLVCEEALMCYQGFVHCYLIVNNLFTCQSVTAQVRTSSRFATVEDDH
jgi:hypothetical protein